MILVLSVWIPIIWAILGLSGAQLSFNRYTALWRYRYGVCHPRWDRYAKLCLVKGLVIGPVILIDELWTLSIENPDNWSNVIISYEL